MTSENSPQGIITVCGFYDKMHSFLANAENNENDSIIMLQSIRDPGNMGTILRTASALGIDMVILSNDCVDIYNPKTIRSAMGAVFKQKTVKVPNTKDLITHLNGLGFETYAAALKQDAKELGGFKLSPKHCFVAGNEGHGLDADIIDACTSAVIIPMMPNNESLNVASASSILMWESCKTKI